MQSFKTKHESLIPLTKKVKGGEMAKMFKKIDNFFLEEENPYTKKRGVKYMQSMIAVVLCVFILSFLSILWQNKKRPIPKDRLSKNIEASSQRQRALFQNRDDDYMGSIDSSKKRGQKKYRIYQASQIIGGGKKENIFFLPKGTTISVFLERTIKTLNRQTPVIAKIKSRVQKDGETVIPAGSTFIGKSTFHAGLKRVCVNFDTVVFPDGRENAVSAMAMMKDGSSCIEGKFLSGKLKKHTSVFLSDVVSGVSEDLKVKNKKESSTRQRLKNGFFNGINKGTTNFIKESAKDYGKSHPQIIVLEGTSLLIYFKQRFEL